MFAIHAPTSVSLITPGADGPFTLINFRANGADTSRCVMEVVTPEGDTHRLTFNQRGKMVDQQFISHDDAPEGEKPVLSEADYVIGGRDTRADNPYTHVAPVNADAMQRGDTDVGFRQPDVFDKDGNPAVNDAEMRKEAITNAQKDADKRFEEARERANETAEQRRERHAKEQDDRRNRAHEELKASIGDGERHAEQVGEPRREPDGSLSDRKSDPEPSRDPGHYDPLVPAASSPLPDSPPPHRIDSANPTGSVINTTEPPVARNPMMAPVDPVHGRVNTTESMRNG